jgi:uncharacterized protein
LQRLEVSDREDAFAADPYPVPIKVYDENHPLAEIGRAERKARPRREMQAIKRLDNQAPQLERRAGGPSLEVFIAGERDASASLGGRSVFGWETDSGKARSG